MALPDAVRGCLAVLLCSVLVGLMGCGRSHSPLGGGNGDFGDLATTFKVTMSPEPSITPPFAGTDVQFAKPVEMETPAAGVSDVAPSPLDQSGVDFRAAWQHNNVTASTGTAVFTPNWDGPASTAAGLSFCCYKFVPNPAGLTPTLTLQWDPEQRLDDVETQCCLGISDWTRNGWEWFAAPADGTVTLETLQPYLGPQGEMLVMVIVMGQQQAALERISLGAPELRGGGWMPDLHAASSLEPQPAEAGDASRSASALPSKFDVISQLPPVQDQGTAASSTAFAAGISFAFELNRVYFKDGWNLNSSFNRPSPRYLYVKTGEDQTPPLVPPTCPDSARDLVGVCNYIRDNGAAAEGHARYSDVPFCSSTFSSDANTDATLLRASSTTTITCGTASTVNSIKTALVTNSKLLAFGLLIDQTFLNLTGGQVWDFTGPAVGGTALAIVGYDDAHQAFIVRNSWGKGWGDGGYGFVAYHVFSTSTGAQIQRVHQFTCTANSAVPSRFVPLNLGVPTNVQASDGTFSDVVSVTWNSVSGATKYKIFRSGTLNGTYTLVGATTSLFFNDPQPTTAEFFYKVRSSNGTDDSLLSAADAGHVFAEAPTGVAASNGTFADHIHVSWNAVSNADSYKVFRASTSIGSYVQIGTATAANHFFDDVQPTTTTFFYKVKTHLALLGDSALSLSDSGNASVPAPTGLTTASVSNGVRLIWNPVTTAGSVKYVVGRSTAQNGPYTSALNTKIDGTTAVVPERETTTFFYAVATSAATAGTSAFSPGVAGHALQAAPTGLAASAGTFADHIHLTWNSPPNDNGQFLYKVYESSTEASGHAADDPQPVATVGNNSSGQQSFDFPTGVTETLHFSVVAVTPDGDTDFSLPASGNAGLAAPLGVLASHDLSDRIHVSWQASPNATAYKIFRIRNSGSPVLIDAISGTQYDDVFGSSSNNTNPVCAYTIKAVGTAGESLASRQAVGFTTTSSVQGVQATQGSFTDKVVISWTGIPICDGFKIFRHDTATGDFDPIGDVAGNATQFSDTTAGSGLHFYKVAFFVVNQFGDITTFFGPASAPVSGFARLPAPTNVQATDGTISDHIHVSWDAVTGAQHYRVFQSPTATGTFSQVGNATDTTSVDLVAATTTPIFFKVKANNTNGDSDFSAADSGFVGVAAPLGVTASRAVFTDHVHLSWNAAANAAGYKILRSASSTSGFTLLSLVGASPPAFDDNVSTAGPFFYRILTVGSSGGDSAPSATVQGSALKPPTISATDAQFSDHLTVSWTAMPDVTSFKLFRASTQTGTFTQIATTGATTIDVSTGNATPQFYKVQSSNGNGDSDFSNTDAGSPAVGSPSNVSASDGTVAGLVRITWTAVTGATSYKVFRATSAAGPFTQIGTPTGTSFDDTTVPAGTMFYKVKATISLGDSVFSAADSGFKP